MSGCPRDLALVDPWEASLQRSRARRARAGGRRRANGAPRATALSTLLEARRRERDLSSAELWELSLGRSRARRRATELQFVPSSSRAKRMSLGALAALSVAPIVSLAEAGSGGGAALASAATVEQPTTTASRAIVLEPGSEGRAVRQLQRALGGIKVDGVFGPETEQAVRGFQTTKGLSADGVVGPQTVAALRDLVATKTSFSSFHPALPGDTATIAGPVAQPSSAGTRVDAALVTSEGSGATGQLGATGSTATSGATAATGESGATGGARASAASDGAGLLEEPSSTGGSSAGAAGESGAVAHEEAKSDAEEAAQRQAQQHERAAVQRLQAALHVTPDGEFGQETEAAIMRLQARHGLTVDGVAGPATWKVIGVHSETTLTPPPSAVPQPEASGEGQPEAGGAAAVAGEGSSSTVKRLQIALHLSPDGEFGPETEAAIQRLQARHGLTPDGVMGPATWSVIGVSDARELNPPQSAIVHEAPASAPAQTEAVAQEGGGSPEGGGEEVHSSAGAVGSGGSGSSGGSGGGDVGGGETSSGGGAVSRVIAAGNEIATRPYVYGGGHGSFQSEGYDCSGSVSYALHGGGLISSPEDSTQLESYGDSGPGKHITIYANSEHAFMVVDGKRFDTVAQAETGTRWSSSMTSTSGFVARHPAGE